MYKSGMSTREVSSFIERMNGDKYSAGSISNITNAVLEDLKEWQERKLKRFSRAYNELHKIYEKRYGKQQEVVS